MGLDKSLEEKGRRGEKDLGQARRRRERGVELRERFKGTSRVDSTLEVRILWFFKLFFCDGLRNLMFS